jgi:hypothetical protein
MSNYQNPHDDDIPRFERWLGVTASAVGPVPRPFDGETLEMEGAEP